MQEPRHLLLERQTLDYQAYKNRQPAESDYQTLITEPSLIYDATTGDLEIVYLHLDHDCSDVITVLERTRYGETERRNGLPSRARVFGNQPRSLPRRDFCTAATLAREDPEGHAIVASYADLVSEHYRRYNPDRYSEHAQLTDRILAEWKLQEGSVFTSGIINYNNPLMYHFDSGNFSRVWSNMLVFRKDAGGGYLACPEYGIAFALPTNSLLMFDGQRVMHGVTPIRLADDESYRFSIVFYSLKQMWNCKPITEEIARAAQRRTERELRRAGLLAEPGSLPAPAGTADTGPVAGVRAGPEATGLEGAERGGAAATLDAPGPEHVQRPDDTGPVGEPA